MPIYLVRWPTLKASLVRARDEAELTEILDQVDDPGSCRWKVYTGPLWVDIDLPVDVELPADKPLSKLTVHDLELEGVEALRAEPLAYPRPIPGSDAEDAGEMIRRIRAWAFPATSAVVDGEFEAWDRREGGMDRARLEAALRQDLAPLIAYLWRRESVEQDESGEAGLMRMLGVTVPVWPGAQGDVADDTPGQIIEMKGKRRRRAKVSEAD